MPNASSTQVRAEAPAAARLAGSAASSAIAAARAAGSSGGTTIPAAAACTASARSVPACAVTTIGRATAMMLSSFDGITAPATTARWTTQWMSPADRNSAKSTASTRSQKRMRPGARLAASRSNSTRSPPAPAITTVTVGGSRAAAAISTSSPCFLPRFPAYIATIVSLGRFHARRNRLTPGHGRIASPSTQLGNMPTLRRPSVLASS